ncbi:MAG TPA: hypothetical protein VJ987_15210, partial [Anaerolineales bacterium]|nr:hypothetical protein [Anaerolineales bacterium]
MFTTRSKYFLLLTLAMVVMLACNALTPATPQPAATLNSLYTAAAETLIVMSTQGAGTQTASPTPTLSLAFASPTD